ncbi:MAG: matrixin family metalloprotease [Gammaproteobacteria bacterium]|nr:matrixin family metalloprotease [Gammaproteobacteria bacterium]
MGGPGRRGHRQTAAVDDHLSRKLLTMTRKRFFTNVSTAVGLVAALLLLTQIVGHSHVSSGLWDAGDIPVRIHLGNLSAAWRNAAIDGLRAWNNAGAAFAFSWSATSRAPADCERYDGTNSVIWSDTQCSLGRRLAWDDNLLAKMHFWTLRSTGAIVDADVMFNDAKRWSIYNGPLRRSGDGSMWDFRRVATHEFGHVLGLDHPDDHGQERTALMNSETSDIDTLQADDVNGVRDLYGSDPGAAARTWWSARSESTTAR